MFKRISILVSMILSLSVVHAEWKLDNEHSYFYFVTTKAEHIAEIGTFKQLQGQIAEDGNVFLTLDLATVDTHLEIRDDRMRDFLFNIIDFPQAAFYANIDLQDIEALDVGDKLHYDLVGEVLLHGQTQRVSTEVVIFKPSQSDLVVAAVKPIIFNASDYDLIDGIEELRALAGLPSIGRAVPVTFLLTFTRELDVDMDDFILTIDR